MNSNQKKLQQMIKDQTLTLTDEELFLSSAYQKYLSSMAKAATGRYRQGLQTLMEWDASDGAGLAYTDNYKIHINAGNHITQSFPSRMLRSESLVGMNGHETAHLLFTDFTTLGLYLRSMENGSFYPEEPSFDDQYQESCEEMLEAVHEKDKAVCLTLSECASHISNILEDIYIEARMCDAYPGIFKQGIELNCLRMNELMPSLQSQIDNGFSDFSIVANLLLQYCRAGTVNNLHGYTGPYLDYLEDCVPFVEESIYSDDVKDRLQLAKTSTILEENNPGITYNHQYLGSGYEKSASDLFRILNSVATEKAEEQYQQEMTEELQKAANDIHYGNAHAGIHVTVNRMCSVPDYLIKDYQSIAPPLLRASKRLQKTIAPLLKEESEGGKLKNLQFGKRLDTRALHHEDGTFFTRTRLPSEEQKLAVGLLIDESGSMSSSDRITYARMTAIVLYDFCQSLQIPVTIYGHTTPDCESGVALYSYAEFDSIDTSDRYRLMDMSARNGNRDGAALRYVAEHLSKRPENQKLLIII